ncbi:MAG TPA: toll/interleukin-1 receptor domain-containing protein [Thermoanaerobaculia bacterium]|nr:toll/interleukin-1 receptor domain-containing protein [Thermoanaerobaculia bacterium]
MYVPVRKIFLSHSSKDKPFVRRLATRLEKHGFQVWLDEKELLVGDSLSASIATALQRAAIVLVIVSPASVASRWLRYELNLATKRMINGQCRVIPILIGDVSLPAEIAGLLYADFRRRFDMGLQSVLRALMHEKDLALLNERLRVERWRKSTDDAVKRVFDGVWKVLSRHRDSGSMGCLWHAVSVPVLSGRHEETLVFYYAISPYGDPLGALTEDWCMQLQSSVQTGARLLRDVISDRPTTIGRTRLSLVVTGRPIRFGVTRSDKAYPMLAYRTFPSDDGRGEDYIVFVERLRKPRRVWVPAVSRSRELLIAFAEQQLRPATA